MLKEHNILEIIELKKYFPVRRSFFSGLEKTSYVLAVNGINFELKPDEFSGLAGESGSGKTTTGELIVRLLEPTSGKILLNGENIAKLRKEHLKRFRKKVQMIFQDPYGTLDPRFNVYHTIEEPLIIYGVKDPKTRLKQIKETLELVELRPPEEYFARFPHELSGGERQRVAIARAIILKPRIIIADEPISMLDISIRAGILNLLNKLRKSLGVAIIYISHNLSTIRNFCDRTAIMYLGEVVEIGSTDEIMENPLHPYTKLLLSSIPVADPNYNRKRIKDYGEIPDQISVYQGCKFAPRCKEKIKICDKKTPTQMKVSREHFVSCHLIRENFKN